VILLGTISCFVWLFLVFVRVLPAISISEMRELVRESAAPPAKGAEPSP
jgi:molybdopterin-containing oxidoreductase family membrane subunit